MTRYHPVLRTPYCDCADSGCSAHTGLPHCERIATERLYRIDMEDWDGTAFCAECADDAMDSGVFTTEVR